jgi:hypothetical protein
MCSPPLSMLRERHAVWRFLGLCIPVHASLGITECPALGMDAAAAGSAGATAAAAPVGAAAGARVLRPLLSAGIPAAAAALFSKDGSGFVGQIAVTAEADASTAGAARPWTGKRLLPAQMMRDRIAAASSPAAGCGSDSAQPASSDRDYAPHALEPVPAATPRLLCPPPLPGAAGLVNLQSGLFNVCYQNSLLQCLFHSEELRQTLLSAPLLPLLPSVGRDAAARAVPFSSGWLLPPLAYAWGGGSGGSQAGCGLDLLGCNVEDYPSSLLLAPAAPHELRGGEAAVPSSATVDTDTGLSSSATSPVAPAHPPVSGCIPPLQAPQGSDLASLAVGNRLQWLIARLSYSQRPRHAAHPLQCVLPPVFTAGKQQDVGEFNHVLSETVDAAFALASASAAAPAGAGAGDAAGASAQCAGAGSGAPCSVHATQSPADSSPLRPLEAAFGGVTATVRTCRECSHTSAVAAGGDDCKPARVLDSEPSGVPALAGAPQAGGKVLLEPFTQLTVQFPGPASFAPITGICAVVAPRVLGKSPTLTVPPGYSRLDADLNADRAGSAPYTYLYVTRDTRGCSYEIGGSHDPVRPEPLAPIVDVRVLVSARAAGAAGVTPSDALAALPAGGAINPLTLDPAGTPALVVQGEDGWVVLPTDLNAGGSRVGDRVYLAYRRGPLPAMPTPQCVPGAGDAGDAPLTAAGGEAAPATSTAAPAAAPAPASAPMPAEAEAVFPAPIVGLTFTSDDAAASIALPPGSERLPQNINSAALSSGASTSASASPAERLYLVVHRDRAIRSLSVIYEQSGVLRLPHGAALSRGDFSNAEPAILALRAPPAAWGTSFAHPRLFSGTAAPTLPAPAATSSAALTSRHRDAAHFASLPITEIVPLPAYALEVEPALDVACELATPPLSGDAGLRITARSSSCESSASAAARGSTASRAACDSPEEGSIGAAQAGAEDGTPTPLADAAGTAGGAKASSKGKWLNKLAGWMAGGSTPREAAPDGVGAAHASTAASSSRRASISSDAGGSGAAAELHAPAPGSASAAGPATGGSSTLVKPSEAGAPKRSGWRRVHDAASLQRLLDGDPSLTLVSDPARPVAGHHLLVRHGHGCALLGGVDILHGAEELLPHAGWETLRLAPPPLPYQICDYFAPVPRPLRAPGGGAEGRLPGSALPAALRGVWSSGFGTKVDAMRYVHMQQVAGPVRALLVNGSFGDAPRTHNVLSGILFRSALPDSAPPDAAASPAAAAGDAWSGTWHFVGSYRIASSQRCGSASLAFKVEAPPPAVAESTHPPAGCTGAAASPTAPSPSAPAGLGSPVVTVNGWLYGAGVPASAVPATHQLERGTSGGAGAAAAADAGGVAGDVRISGGVRRNGGFRLGGRIVDVAVVSAQEFRLLTAPATAGGLGETGWELLEQSLPKPTPLPAATSSAAGSLPAPPPPPPQPAHHAALLAPPNDPFLSAALPPFGRHTANLLEGCGAQAPAAAAASSGVGSYAAVAAGSAAAGAGVSTAAVASTDGVAGGGAAAAPVADASGAEPAESSAGVPAQAHCASDAPAEEPAAAGGNDAAPVAPAAATPASGAPTAPAGGHAQPSTANPTQTAPPAPIAEASQPAPAPPALFLAVRRERRVYRSQREAGLDEAAASGSTRSLPLPVVDLVVVTRSDADAAAGKPWAEVVPPQSGFSVVTHRPVSGAAAALGSVRAFTHTPDAAAGSEATSAAVDSSRVLADSTRIPGQYLAIRRLAAPSDGSPAADALLDLASARALLDVDLLWEGEAPLHGFDPLDRTAAFALKPTHTATGARSSGSGIQNHNVVVSAGPKVNLNGASADKPPVPRALLALRRGVAQPLPLPDCPFTGLYDAPGLSSSPKGLDLELRVVAETTAVLVGGEVGFDFTRRAGALTAAKASLTQALSTAGVQAGCPPPPKPGSSSSAVAPVVGTGAFVLPSGLAALAAGSTAAAPPPPAPSSAATSSRASAWAKPSATATPASGTLKPAASTSQPTQPTPTGSAAGGESPEPVCIGLPGVHPRSTGIEVDDGRVFGVAIPAADAAAHLVSMTGPGGMAPAIAALERERSTEASRAPSPHSGGGQAAGSSLYFAGLWRSPPAASAAGGALWGAASSAGAFPPLGAAGAGHHKGAKGGAAGAVSDASLAAWSRPHPLPCELVFDAGLTSARGVYVGGPANHAYNWRLQAEHAVTIAFKRDHGSVWRHGACLSHSRLPSLDVPAMAAASAFSPQVLALDNRIDCAACGRRTEHDSAPHLLLPPEHLAVLLARMNFELRQGRVVKITSHVQVPLTMALPAPPADVTGLLEGAVRSALKPGGGAAQTPQPAGSEAEHAGLLQRALAACVTAPPSAGGGAAGAGAGHHPSPPPQPQQHAYALYGVIMHAGETANAGHYFAYCRRSHGPGVDLRQADCAASPWRKLNDTRVEVLPWDRVAQEVHGSTYETPYLLFYKRIPSSPAAAADDSRPRSEAMPLSPAKPSPTRMQPWLQRVFADNDRYMQQLAGPLASPLYADLVRLATAVTADDEVTGPAASSTADPSDSAAS